ncbi:MAG: PspC domain-containing protein [Bacteroidales bacterium]|nr:PspC domain-containing protein [Bacteroidales bacterium]
MKKTVNINLNGIGFTLDEDAYDVLEEYLNSINAHFKNKEGGAEIIKDIEARIAELFQQLTAAGKQVLDVADVNNVKEQLGKPSDFDEEEPIHEEEFTRSFKRLYRDPMDRIIGGVCSGLGAYFHVDPVWVRILFVIATLSGVSPLVYLILWIIMPPARTASDRLEMRGEPVNISNIEKVIREEFNGIRDRVDDLADKTRKKFSKKKP